MIAAIACAAVGLVLFFSRVYILDWFRYKLPPGPRPKPLFGTIGALSELAKKGIKPQFKVFLELSKQYGKMFTLYPGQVRMLVIADPDLIHEAFVVKANSFSSRPNSVVKVKTKIGVIAANFGDTWRNRRRFVMRSMRDFGMGRSNIVERIHDEIGFLVQEIDQRSGKPFVPHHLISNAVSNIVCTIVFGKRFDYQDPFFKSLLDITSQVFAIESGKDFIPFMFPVTQHFYSPKQLQLLVTLEQLIMGMVVQCIEEHRKTFSSENIRDFIDLYIDAEFKNEEALTLAEFSRIALDLFLAGTETTTTTLLWTLAFFCKYPEIQKRSLAAVDAVMGASDRFPTLNDRPDLAYIDAVMYEALRHPTIIPLGVFHATDACTTLGGYDIPAKTIVIPNIWQVHHDESYWEEPHAFNPDRWLDAGGKLLNHGNHFIPFGTGPRICLGESLARAEYFVFLVSLLQRFSFKFGPGEDIGDIYGGFAGITNVPQHFKLVATSRH